MCISKDADQDAATLECENLMNISAEEMKRAFSAWIILLIYTESSTGVTSWKKRAPNLDGKWVQDYFSASKIPNCFLGKKTMQQRIRNVNAFPFHTA